MTDSRRVLAESNVVVSSSYLFGLNTRNTEVWASGGLAGIILVGLRSKPVSQFDLTVHICTDATTNEVTLNPTRISARFSNNLYATIQYYFRKAHGISLAPDDCYIKLAGAIITALDNKTTGLNYYGVMLHMSAI